jgi:hypothetical protein
VIAETSELTPEVIRDHARARMLITLGEPDLSDGEGVSSLEDGEKK